MIPFFANKGFYPRMSFSPDSTDYDTTRKRLDAARAGDISNRMQEILDFISHNMANAQDAMAQQANKHRSNVEFKEGDMVFLSSKNIDSDRPSKKLDSKRYGPFEVKERVGLSYRLILPPTMRIHDVFHPKLLTFAAQNPLPGQRNPPPLPIVVDGVNEWNVEEILDAKAPRGKLKFRVKWAGYDDDLTWYNADAGEFDKSRDLVEDFYRRYPDKPKGNWKPSHRN